MGKLSLTILRSVMVLAMALISGCAVGGEQALKLDESEISNAKIQAMNAAGDAANNAASTVNSASNNAETVISAGGV